MSSPSEPPSSTLRHPPKAASASLLQSLRLMWSLLSPHFTKFCFALFALLVGSGINLLFPQLARVAVNDKMLHSIVANPLPVLLIVGSLFAVQGLAFYVRALWFGTIGHDVVFALRSRLFASLLSMPIEFFDQQKSSDLVSRLTVDCAQIQDAVSIKLSVLVRYTLQVLVGVLLMALLTPTLTVLLVVGLPVLIGLTAVLSRVLKKVSRQLQTELGATSAIADEVFSGQRVIRAFGAERRESNRFGSANARVRDLGVRRSRISAFFSSFVNFLMNGFLIFVVLYGIILVDGGTLLPGDLTAFLLYAAIVGVSFAFLVGSYAEFIQSMGGAERVFELLRGSTDSKLPELQTVKREPAAVEFRDVQFAYPSRPSVEVLRGISFSVLPGSTVAIVGASGAGKSSVVALLLGLYTPSAGSIIVDNQSLTPENATELRSHFSYVPQDPVLFGVSLRENLLMGDPTASEAEMTKLFDELGLGSFLRSLPEGLDTLVGDRGIQLSGGQRQRVALARALLRGAGILILDEATSGVDSETEDSIRLALKARHRHKTIIVIAHRLATVRDADEILVLNQGLIAERGRHEALLEAGALYSSLVERQDLRVASQSSPARNA